MHAYYNANAEHSRRGSCHTSVGGGAGSGHLSGPTEGGHHQRSVHDLSNDKYSISPNPEMYADLTTAILHMRSEQFIFGAHDRHNMTVHFPPSYPTTTITNTTTTTRRRTRPHTVSTQPNPRPSQPHRSNLAARDVSIPCHGRDPLVTTTKEPLEPSLYGDTPRTAPLPLAHQKGNLYWITDWTCPPPSTMRRRESATLAENTSTLAEHQYAARRRRWTIANDPGTHTRRLSAHSVPSRHPHSTAACPVPLAQEPTTGIDKRRLSTESDKVSCTDIVRRFSNGSTTSTKSTAPSAASSITSVGWEDKEAGMDKSGIVDSPLSADASETTTAHELVTTDLTLSHLALSKVAPEEEKQSLGMAHQPARSSARDDTPSHPGPESGPTTAKDREPGHDCDTRTMAKEEGSASCSPSTDHDHEHDRDLDNNSSNNNDNNSGRDDRNSNSNSNSNSNEDDQELPVWADRARIDEHPHHFEHVKSYLREHALSFSSSLPLPETVTVHFSDTSSAKQKPGATHYLSTVKPLFDCNTVWDFSARWRAFKKIQAKPSQMQPNQNLYCFRKDVEPMWEHEANRHGGRLTLCPPRTSLDDLFEWVLCAYVGGSLAGFGLVGVVFSRRSRGDRIELWLDRTATSGSVASLKDTLQSILPDDHATYPAIISASRFKKHYEKSTASTPGISS